ncbi:MAG: TetR/AcrR family transcriptional regulator [Acidimicrobiales bacterium]
MDAVVNRRAYDSTSRARQATESREHIARVAHDMFVERGYRGTTVAAVAAAAGVSPATVYAGFGNKAALLRRAFYVVLHGDDVDLKFYERPEALEIAEMKDPDAQIALIARLTAERNRLSAALLPVIRVAADEDADARAMLDDWQEGLLTLATLIAAVVAQGGRLAGSEECRDVMYATLSGDLWQRLVAERGWSDERFADWLVGLWRQQILAG